MKKLIILKYINFLFIIIQFKTNYFQEIFSKEENLFNLKQGDVQPQLLILDRREDPVTPLLMPVKILLFDSIKLKL